MTITAKRSASTTRRAAASESASTTRQPSGASISRIAPRSVASTPTMRTAPASGTRTRSRLHAGTITTQTSLIELKLLARYADEGWRAALRQPRRFPDKGTPVVRRVRKVTGLQYGVSRTTEGISGARRPRSLRSPDAPVHHPPATPVRSSPRRRLHPHRCGRRDAGHGRRLARWARAPSASSTPSAPPTTCARCNWTRASTAPPAATRRTWSPSATSPMTPGAARASAPASPAPAG